MTRTPPTESALLRGAEGHIEVLIDAPESVRGVALVCHPHPLFGGANTNKVAHTLARTFRDLGFAAWARARASMTKAMAKPKTCCR